ncbi:unnamed protein product [Rhizoctonia solani]|uniref:DOPA 4,5-dioxygenase n=1 Tax=Rhizoctonia solani TaxID=456999 RepID=A0A8H2X2R0_9AGAM|nr:unnamed protein product [Rhizoctonia solani]
MQVTKLVHEPPTDVERVVQEEIREWHFHIYFLQRNTAQHAAALALRDAVLRLRRDGAFVAVPLYRVNTTPVGPHPAGKPHSSYACLSRLTLGTFPFNFGHYPHEGSYEIWVPSESFASVYSYLCQHRGDLSVLVHPLTREERKDHEYRQAWMGPSFPLDLDTLPIRSEEIPLQYPLLKMGYSSIITGPTLEERKAAGRKVEETLRGEKEAAPAPTEH